MIKIGNRDITLKLGSTNVSAAYLGSVQVYGGSPSYDLCYGVTDDISTYTGTFKDVFDKSSETWYKLNNLNEYEEYGVYGSGRTSCESSSRLPQGYTEVEYIRQNSNYDAYINTDVFLFDNTTNSYIVTTKLASEFHSNLSCATIISAEVPQSPYNGMGYRYKCSTTVNEFEFFGANNNYSASSVDNGDGTRTITFQSTGNTSWTSSAPLSLLCSFSDTSFTIPFRYADATIYSSIIVKNGVTVRNYVPAKRDSDSKYGLYDLVTNTFYTSPNGNNFIGGKPITPTDCVTTYDGKLTIDDGYEYMYTGGSWVNVGEVSGSSRVPDTYEELEYIGNSSSGTNYYIDSGFKPNQNTRMVVVATPNTLTNNPRMFGTGPYNALAFVGNIESANPPKFYYKFGQTSSWYQTSVTAVAGVKYTFDLSKDGYYIDGTLAGTPTQSTFQLTTNIGLFNAPAVSNFWDNETFIGYIHSSQIYDNNTLIRDYVPVRRKSDNKTGMYDIVNNTFTTAVNTSHNFLAGPVTGSVEYPIHYDEKADPLDNLTFNTIAEAEAYAYANCVYDGMKATIAGEKYVFDSENGWTVVPEYYKVEDVTPQGASGWTITGSSTYNPDSSYYDDFSVVNTTTTNVTKIAKVTIYGYDHFTYYLRSYAYNNYAYVYATNVDELSSDPTTNFGYNSSSAITNTFGWNKNQGSAVNLSNYRRVTYNNLDKTVEHTFYIVFYGRTYSSYQANATILIPKDQTNENWEQVTFSASSNVASSQKNLYIDNNNSTSGGTNQFYYRWMIGLPSGTHTGYTNYSNYDYCGSVTSATFTSVALEQRQVNYTYDNTTNKSLSVRLTDGSGNTLSPSDTVYYNMTHYNSCGVSSSSSNTTFPRNITEKVGGRFRFTNSSNRHYIYGYTPSVSLNTDYYTDNYQSTFDIVYTKLSEEAVTLSYVTYDPNDSETPSFNTDITYPYSGGTTSATTLTSFNVPYTYPYTVAQTSNLFSADTYTYTAGQASRAITFTLYPNNREFSTVADLEAYQYVWEGMKAFVGDTKYKYEDGQWVEVTHSLPDVPFMVNYNAKNYDAQNYTLKKTEGQSKDVDAVCNYGYGIVDHSSDGYITVTANTRMNITGTPYFNRSNDETGCTMTIVSKVRTTDGYSILTNRGGTGNQMNWMWRYPSNGIFLHGSSNYSSPKYNVSTTSQPIVASVRTYYDNGVKQKLRDHTNNGSYDGLFSYGYTYEGNSSLFVDYNTHNSEFWRGDFYWVYMTFSVLTDEQILEVIDYNENL